MFKAGIYPALRHSCVILAGIYPALRHSCVILAGIYRFIGWFEVVIPAGFRRESIKYS
jgi:hypothetical protein